jgi:hypothetical protein
VWLGGRGEMEMKTMEKPFIFVLSGLLIVLCLPIEHKSQVKPADNRPSQELSSVPKAGLSRWQTVRLSGKGIEFKLPPDWRHDGFDLEKKTDNFIMEEVDWNSPKKELIKVLITTYPKGYISLKRTVASKEELLEEELNSVMQSRDPSFSEVKRLKLSGVEGVFSWLRFDFKDKDIGVRTGPIWTGFRIYGGEAQEIEIQLSSNPQGEELLRTIFNTIEIKQDKEASPTP